MKVAFVGHPYHQKTRSADFFVKLLVDAGLDIEFFYDDFFYTNEPTCLARLLDGDHDAVFLWQTEYLAPQLLAARKRVAVIPMYDAARLHRPDFWQALGLVRVISFCRAMHNELQEQGLDSNYFQYFPDPADFPDANRDRPSRDLPRGFIWLRRPWDGIDWDDARAILKATNSGSAQLHLAIDDGATSEFKPPSRKELEKLNIETSDWYPSKADLQQAICNCDYFVTPRYFEGVGFSFLEAMAMGVCPIASDTPTMNEYIFQAENGLLFEAGSEDRLPALGVDQLRDLGQRARQSIAQGRERWERDIPRLLDRLLNLSRPPARHRDYSFHIESRVGAGKLDALERRRAESAAPPACVEVNGTRYWSRIARPTQPKLSVVTVVRDDVKGLKRTMATLACQTYEDFEYIIVDGNSSQDLLSEVGPLAHVVDEFISQTDEGPYDAMMHGAGIARGEFVYFLNAGDQLFAADTLERAMRVAAPDVDFVYGDHVWIRKDGSQLHHPARDFDRTWELLQLGYLDGRWLSGIPAHQATFTRTTLLRESRYDLRFLIAADHEFMFRMRAEGATFRHCMETVARYHEGGMSSNRFARCQREWYEIATMYGSGDGIHDFYAPAVGYDLRHAGKVGGDRANANGEIPGKRNRLAEVAGAMANGLPRDSAAYKVARSVWHAVKPVSTN